MAQKAIDFTQKTVKLTLHWNRPPVGDHTCVANVYFYVKRLDRQGRLDTNCETIDQSAHEEVKFTGDSTALTATLSVDDDDRPLIIAKVELLADVKPRSDFAVPTLRTDCVLEIGARHFYLEKALSGVLLRLNSQCLQALFRMSEYFSALFCGKYVEGDHELVSINDVDPEEFLQVLQTSEGSLQITGDNVEGILRAAYRFLVDSVLMQCDHFILTSAMALGERLLLADRCRRKECFEKLLAFVRDVDHLKQISEESTLKVELSRNGLEMLYEVALKLGHANGSDDHKPIF